MTLALTLVLGTVALTALFWGLTVVLQGYLYNQVADRIPLRAVVGGLAVASFITFWTYLNTHASHPDKYGPVLALDHMMNPTTYKDVTEFEAVRRLGVKDEKGQPKETTVPFKWEGDLRTGRFVEPGTTKEFKTNSSEYVTVALLVPDGDRKVRFDAVLDDAGRYATPNKEFREEGGPRYIEGASPRRMIVPSTAALVLALAVNVLHLVVWFLVFWLVMRFTAGHAIGLTAVFGGVAMFVLMPLLFNLNAPKTPSPSQQQQATAPK